MRIKDTIKKTAAFITLLTIALPNVMVNTVFASTQRPVSIRTMTSNVNDITLTWDFPGAVTPDAQDAVYNTANFSSYGAEGYNVQRRNVTLGKPVSWTQPDATILGQQSPAAGASFTDRSFISLMGMLYSYRVVPYHYHEVIVNMVSRPSEPIVPADNQIPEALYMSDIEVNAKGSTDSLTVEWDCPSYGSTPAYQNFIISYKREDEAVYNNSVVVSYQQSYKIGINDAASKGPRLRYTITDPDKIYPGAYHVSVEPCNAAGQKVRGTSGTSTVTINGVNYPITFSPSTKLYETKTAYVSLPVWIEEEGRENLNLVWGDISGFPGITEIAIFSESTPEKLVETLQTYMNPPAEIAFRVTPTAKLSNGYATYYRIPMLNDTLYYGIVVTYQGGVKMIPSEAVAYVPGVFLVAPSTPEIHEINRDKDFSENVLTLYWDAFLRARFDNVVGGDTAAVDMQIDSRTYTYDNAVKYDVYISDDLDVVSRDPAELANMGVNPKQISASAVPHSKEIGGVQVPAISGSFSNYFDKNGKEHAFQPNMLYYIRIIAKKDKASGGFLEAPSSAYTTFYISAAGNISQPPMIRKPPLEIRYEDTTESSLGVWWLEEWSEVYDYTRDLSAYDPSNSKLEWQTKALIDGTTIKYGADAAGEDVIYFASMDNFNEIRTELGFEQSYKDSVPVRRVRLRESTEPLNSVSYEIKWMEYPLFDALIKKYGSLDAYLQYIKDNEPLGASDGTSRWVKASVSDVKDDDGLNRKYVTVSGLKPNTNYAILVRPYRIVNGEDKIGYANFVAGVTAPEDSPLYIKPVQPIIYKKDVTDTSVTIFWENKNGIDYELVYSTVLYRDIEAQASSGTTVPFETIMTDSVVKKAAEPENGNKTSEYRYFTVDGLFPETEYYFWLRARAQVRHPEDTSFYSNPVWAKTSAIKTPASPAGFGVASSNDVKLINEADGTDFTPRNKNYIIMEWMKDTYDAVKDGTGASTDVADILTEPTITEMYIAKFNNLISNKIYYFRAKTILTVTMGQDGKTQSEYTYLVQICLDPDFVDMQEIYVPQEPTITEPYRQAQSAWTKTVFYRTSTSDDDYDSDFDPDLVPLPETDFEILYDGKTLTYRFRASGKDDKGNYNNRVDQRFISKLVNQRVHNYNIDVTKYEDITVKRRVVEVPYTLLRTFDERKITLGIRAGDVTLRLPPGVMETPQVKNIPDYGDNAKLHIIFTEDPANAPGPGFYDTYATTPQDVSLYLWTPTQYMKMPYGGVPLGVRLKLDNRYDLMDSNLGSYVSNEQTQGWSKVNSVYDKENGRLDFKTQPGVYAIIAKTAPDTVYFDQSTPYMLNVASKLTPTDITVYNGNAAATSNQMLNIIDALINSRSETAINKIPDANTVAAIQKAGMNIASGATSVSREQAIAAMVRLYEIKSKQQIKTTYTVLNTPYRDTASAQPAYQLSLLKAAEIDMLNGRSEARPKDSLTLGELFELADVIISDLGY